MKKLVVFCILAAVLSACETPESEKTPAVLEMTPVTSTPDALRESVVVKVQCDLHWKVELEDSSWGKIENIVAEEGKGGQFTLVTGVNLAETSRENTLVIRAGKGELRKTVIQGGIGSFFRPRSLQLSGTQEGKLVFDAPSEWSAKLVSGSDWLIFQDTQGAAGQATLVCVAKDDNRNVGSREASIQVTIGSNRFDIPVVQGQKDVILSDDTALEFNFEAQEFSVRTLYNVDYTVRCTESWVKHSSGKAPLHQAEEVFTLEENSSTEARSAKIIFDSDGHPEAGLTVFVTQNGRDPIMNVTEPGLYGIDGTHYLPGLFGWNQSSRIIGSDGRMGYRLMNAASLETITLSQLPQDAAAGSAYMLKVKMMKKNTVTYLKEFNATVLMVKDGCYWIKVSPETYFVVQM